MYKVISFLLLSTILYFLVFQTSTQFNGYDEKRIIEVVILILSLLSVTLNTRLLSLITGSHSLIILVLILGLLSSFFAPSPEFSFIEVSMYAGLWALAIYTAMLTVTASNEKVIIYFSCAISIAAIVYLLSFFVGYIAFLVEDYPQEPWHLFRGYANIRFFNQFQVWVFSLLTLLYFEIPINLAKFKKVLLVIIALWWMLLFLSASRAALLSLLTAWLVIAVVYGRSSLRFVKVQFYSGIIGLGLYLVFFVLLPFVSHDHEPAVELVRSGIPGRLLLWQSAIELSLQNPILGVGPMHFAWYPNLHAHPHNSILQWLAEWGVIATSLLLWVFLTGAYKWHQKFNKGTIAVFTKQKAHVVIALAASSSAGLFYSLASGVFVMPQSQIMLAITVGMMLGLYVKQHSDCSVSFVRDKAYLLHRSMFAGFLLLLIVSISPTLFNRLDKNYLPDFAAMKVITPRLWLHGGIPHQ